jgi:Skp family chaperone for outer membrane proteins
MTKLTKILFVALFVLGLAVSPVRAEDAKKPISIAVVDIQALLKDSKGAQSVESQLATIRKDFQGEVDTTEKTLRDAEKAILDQKGKIAEDEFNKKAADFQKQVAESQKKIQDRKGKLDKALATAVGKLRTEIVKIVAEIGEKNNLDLVVARTDVVIVSKDLDITQQVLERLDADLPSVKVTVE